MPASLGSRSAAQKFHQSSHPDQIGKSQYFNCFARFSNCCSAFVTRCRTQTSRLLQTPEVPV